MKVVIILSAIFAVIVRKYTFFIKIFYYFLKHIFFLYKHQSVSNASLSKVLKPVLQDTVPLTDGLDTGLKESAPQLDVGLDKTGAGLDNVVSGIGSILSGTVSGLGETLRDLPRALFDVVHKLDQPNAGLIGGLLNNLL